MRHSAVISEADFRNAREQSDDMWSDYEVFDEERDKAPLRELVLEVVEGQYTHPSGPDSVYGMEGSADDLVWDKVFHDGLVPDSLPKDVKEKFARELGEAVRKNSTTVFKKAREELDDDASLSEVRSVIEPLTEQTVSKGF